MSRRDLFQHNASNRATSELEYVIKGKKKQSESIIPTVTPQQAMRGERFFQADSNRNVTRVLFVSRNSELLNPTKQTLDGYINISELFDEVHILILRQGIAPRNPVLRVSHNVWIYTAAAKYWWLTPQAGFEMVQEQLEFASGFRPDLVVARDPFESAVVVIKLQKKYRCATQLHIMEDYKSEKFHKFDKRNFWRSLLAKFTIPKFVSIRTLTVAMQNVVQTDFSVPDLAILPRYQNYEALIDSPDSIDLKQKYTNLIFFIVFVGKLEQGSTLFRVIDAVRFVLKNPRVGLIVLGDGKLRSEFERRARLLGVERQVIFERVVPNLVSYLKSASILIVSDTNADSEEVVLKGAAAGIPMIMSRTDKREDIFEYGESAFLCEPESTQEFTERTNDLLNDIQLRRKFVEKGQELIREQFHSDPDEYRHSYRTSIEQAFFVEMPDKEVSNISKTAKNN